MSPNTCPYTGKYAAGPEQSNTQWSVETTYDPGLREPEVVGTTRDKEPQEGLTNCSSQDPGRAWALRHLATRLSEGNRFVSREAGPSVVGNCECPSSTSAHSVSSRKQRPASSMETASLSDGSKGPGLCSLSSRPELSLSEFRGIGSPRHASCELMPGLEQFSTAYQVPVTRLQHSARAPFTLRALHIPFNVLQGRSAER